MLTCIFACTVSKTLEPTAPLQVRRYRTLEVEKAIQIWKGSLTSAPEKASVARLYKGGYWAIARQLVQDTRFPMQALVASAGVGLRDFTERIPAYDATFNSSDRDTVPGGEDLAGQIRWWEMLGGRCRLRALAEDDRSRIAVALPGQYLRVVMPDLLFVQQELGPRAITVFTTNPQAIDQLGASAVPLEGRMSRVLGGAAGQLTVRALDHVVRAAGQVEDITPGRARILLNDVLQQAPQQLYPKRKKQTEAEVRMWIEHALSMEDPPKSATGALRMFRSEGFGYEQKRFGRLFREVQEELT